MSCALVACLAACGDDDGTSGSPEVCRAAIAGALSQCVTELGTVYEGCYESAGELCGDDDAAVAAALVTAGESVKSGCPADSVVRSAGYGPVMTIDGLATRVAETCRGEATAVAVRTFGGPQGAALVGADDGERQCLRDAFAAALDLIGDAVGLHDDCLRDPATCDAVAVGESLAVLEDEAAAAITAACPALVALVGSSPAIFAARTVAQADCITAASHPDTAPLHLACGPRAEATPLPRGEYVQVVLDEEEWGTRCGDGSPYAFQVRLAPEGAPVENVLVGLQGGGVCIFEQDCANVPASLFEALSDDAPTGGIFSNDPEVSPFADWTKVFLPYCTQDVFIGGGRTSEFSSVTVHRYGAVNTRQALRYVRNILWEELDRTSSEGYHPRRVRAFLGGFSAGAFGTLYNYHWVLDDLSWPRTTAYPDAGLALDNGQQLGVRALGGLLLSEPPLGWGARAFTPPYCFRGECAVGPIVLERSAPRLLRLPEQQYMILTNQVDQTQVETTFFSSTVDWVNAMRDSYCATKDLAGVSYFMPAEAQSIHVISDRTDLFTQRAVDGVTMQEWFTDAIASPADVVNHVEEGNLVEARPGVMPFDCEVAP